MRQADRQLRGSVLVTAMWICIALTAVALVLCREMTVESLTTVQHLSQAKADAAERGVEQLVLAWVTSDVETPGSLDAVSMEQRQLGDCYFWIIKSNPEDEQTPAYGLTREAGRLDINTATYEQLMALPNMTDELASAIIDWRDTDDEVTGLDGAEDSYYMQLEHPYHCKNSNFESLEEIHLVKGATPDILAGADNNQDGTIEDTEMQNANDGVSFQTSARGILDCLTVYGSKGTNPPSTASTIAGTVTDPATGNTETVVDVNATGNAASASMLLQKYVAGKRPPTRPQGTGFQSVFDWAVKAQLTSQEFALVYPFLTCKPGAANPAAGTAVSTTPVAKLDIMEATEATMVAAGLDDSEAQAIITYRTTTSTDPAQRSNIAWLLDLVSQDKFTTAGALPALTGTSTVYSAEIVTVTKDGRAFKRVKIVIDGSTYANALLESTTGATSTSAVTSGVNTPVLIHRDDRTSAGWPLSPEIRASLRSGKGLEEVTAPGTAGNTLNLQNP